MNSKLFRVCLLVLLLYVKVDVYAQRVVTRSGTYTYPISESVSMEEAKVIALEKARLQVIADEFGTVVDMSTMTQVHDSNEMSSVEMISYGLSDVKGEWIEDIEEPKFNVSYEQGILSVTVTVKGKIREIVSAEIDFKAKILRNGVDERFENNDFESGDDFYMSFISPVNGYMAVYLYDGQMVYCLLPYAGQEDGYFCVKRNVEYILFSSDNASTGLSPYIVDEYVLTASKEKEFNMIYIIFSPNRFTKALDEVTEELLPRFLDYKSFQKWLVKCRVKDKDMRVQRKTITISNG